MIPAWKNPDTDVWEPIRDNPTILRLDGEVRAPLAVIMSPSWTWEERWEYGVFEVIEESVPDGFRKISATYHIDPNMVVRENITVEPIMPIEITKDRIHGKGNAGFGGKVSQPGGQSLRRR